MHYSMYIVCLISPHHLTLGDSVSDSAQSIHLLSGGLIQHPKADSLFQIQCHVAFCVNRGYQ